MICGGIKMIKLDSLDFSESIISIFSGTPKKEKTQQRSEGSWEDPISKSPFTTRDLPLEKT